MKRDLPTECGGCGVEERWLFHHVSVRSTYRRLCTSCVLKLHSGSFCPICFEVYGSNPPVLRAVCSRCPSVTHLHCVTQEAVATYVCPPCSNPNFTFFDTSGEKTILNENMAKVLVAAAQIAYATMSKAASEMRSESQRKVKEAAWKRKEAKESLQRLAALVTRDNKGKEAAALAHNRSPANAVLGEQKNNVKGQGAVSSTAVSQKRFENLLSIEANNAPVRLGVSSNNSNALVQHNAVVHEKQENGLVSAPADSRKVQHLRNGPNNEGQGNSKNGHPIAQLHQGSLIIKSSEAHLGSSNMASKIAHTR